MCLHFLVDPFSHLLSLKAFDCWIYFWFGRHEQANDLDSCAVLFYVSFCHRGQTQKSHVVVSNHYLPCLFGPNASISFVGFKGVYR